MVVVVGSEVVVVVVVLLGGGEPGGCLVFFGGVFVWRWERGQELVVWRESGLTLVLIWKVGCAVHFFGRCEAPAPPSHVLDAT